MDKAVFVGQDVVGKLVSVITEAKKYVFMVTPYLKLGDWTLVRLPIQQATKKGIDVTFIVRRGDRDNVANSSVE